MILRCRMNKRQWSLLSYSSSASTTNISIQWRRYLWGIGARAPPLSFGNSVHSVAVASITLKISKITKEERVLNFHLSRQKHAKTHVNRLKQSRNAKEIPGRGG